jgi:hypothetical protein
MLFAARSLKVLISSPLSAFPIASRLVMNSEQEAFRKRQGIWYIYSALTMITWIGLPS